MPAVNDPAASPPARRPGLLRPAALWLLPLAILVLAACLPLVVEPWLAARLRQAVALAGLELAPATTIDVSLLGGRVTLADLDLREYVAGQPRSLLKADRAELDVAVLACLGGDVVLDRVALLGASGDLRRRGDGSIPLATPPPEERPAGDTTDWGKLDWWSYARRAWEWHRAREAEAETGSAPPPKPRPATDWQGARQHQPPPGPAGPPMRVRIRALEVSGRELLLPDDTPFAVTAFALTGRNLGWGRREAGEPWSLDLDATTRAAGRVTFACGTGSLQIGANALPLTALAHPALAGDAIARHGASGTADLRLAAAWTQTLSGDITATVAGLKLQPREPTPRQAQVARILDRLGGRPLTWTMRLGGTPQEPQITDDGLEALVKGQLADVAKEAAIEEGLKRLDQQLDKHEKIKEVREDERVKKAEEKAKELLKGWGK